MLSHKPLHFGRGDCDNGNDGDIDDVADYGGDSGDGDDGDDDGYDGAMAHFPRRAGGGS